MLHPVRAFILVVAAVIASLFVGSVAGAFYAGDPTFTASSPSVLAGGEVNLTGTGCQPGELVTFSFGGESAGSATADGTGSFSFALTVPESTPPGTYTVTASCGELVQSFELTVAGGGDLGAPIGTGSLSRTGTEVGPLAALGIGLIVIGGIFILQLRRRSVAGS